MLLRYALEVALEHDKPTAALRAYYNLADGLDQLDRYDEAARAVHDGLALARKVGNRYWEWALVGAIYPAFALGNWDEATAMISAVPEEHWAEARQTVAAIVSTGIIVYAEQGRFADAERIVDALPEFAASADVQERASYACGIARLRLRQGDLAEALGAAKTALESGSEMGMTSEFMKEAFVTAVDAALLLGNTVEAEELLALAETLPPGRQAQFLQAHVSRFRARLAAVGEGSRAEDLFKGAVGLFRELAIPFYMAVTQVEYAEWLVGRGGAEVAEPLLAEAREIFERLGAGLWLDRTAPAAGDRLAAESPAH